MDKESLKRLAVVECCVLWDFLSQTGGYDKFSSITHLHEIGKLSLESYNCCCPFCQYLKDIKKEHRCEDCLWPGDKEFSYRCELDDSLFIKWKNAKNNEDRSQAAKKVLEMLKQIPMD